MAPGSGSASACSSGVRKDRGSTRANDSGRKYLPKSRRFSPPMMSSTRQLIFSEAASVVAVVVRLLHINFLHVPVMVNGASRDRGRQAAAIESEAGNNAAVNKAVDARPTPGIVRYRPAGATARCPANPPPRVFRSMCHVSRFPYRKERFASQRPEPKHGSGPFEPPWKAALNFPGIAVEIAVESGFRPNSHGLGTAGPSRAGSHRPHHRARIWIESLVSSVGSETAHGGETVGLPPWEKIRYCGGRRGRRNVDLLMAPAAACALDINAPGDRNDLRPIETDIEQLVVGQRPEPAHRTISLAAAPGDAQRSGPLFSPRAAARRRKH